MNRRHLLPIVLSLAMAGPASAGMRPTTETDEVHAGLSVGQPLGHIGRAARPPRRRRRESPRLPASPCSATIALAGEYLRVSSQGCRPRAMAQAAWEGFFPWCDGTIRRFAMRFGHRGVDPDECAQETWIDLLRRLPRFEHDHARGRFSSWLYSVVRNKAHDLLRTRLRRPASPLAEAPAVASNESTPDRAAQLEEERSVVRDALSRLRERSSEQSYQVLQLRFVEGLCVREVADALGLSPEQVWVREHRMKRKLRDLLVESVA